MIQQAIQDVRRLGKDTVTDGWFAHRYGANAAHVRDHLIRRGLLRADGDKYTSATPSGSGLVATSSDRAAQPSGQATQVASRPLKPQAAYAYRESAKVDIKVLRMGEEIGPEWFMGKYGVNEAVARTLAGFLVKDHYLELAGVSLWRRFGSAAVLRTTDSTRASSKRTEPSSELRAKPIVVSSRPGGTVDLVRTAEARTTTIERRGAVAEQGSTTASKRATCWLCPEKAGGHGFCGVHRQRFYNWRRPQGYRGTVADGQAEAYVRFVRARDGSVSNASPQSTRVKKREATRRPLSATNGHDQGGIRSASRKVVDNGKSTGRTGDKLKTMVLSVAAALTELATQLDGRKCQDPDHDRLKEQLKTREARIRELDQRVRALQAHVDRIAKVVGTH